MASTSTSCTSNIDRLGPAPCQQIGGDQGGIVPALLLNAGDQRVGGRIGQLVEPALERGGGRRCPRARSRGYYRPGVGAAVGLGVLGAAALGAAAAAPYYGYGGNPCLRQQQVVDAWGNAQWAYVRVC